MYLFVQEERNGDMMPIIDNHVLSSIFVLVEKLCSISVIFWMASKVFGYSIIVAKYIWTTLWNSLTTGNQWLEIGTILTSICLSIVMCLGIQSIGEMLDRGFTKLKDEIKKKDEIIKELEEKVLYLDEKNSYKEKSATKVIKSEKDE